MGRSAPLLMLGALLAGGLIGEAAGLEGRLERLGEAIKRRLGGQASFVEGFVLASVVACVGPLAVLGAFADDLRGDLSLLVVKSLLDGFAMLAFASYLGPLPAAALPECEIAGVPARSRRRARERPDRPMSRAL